MGRHSESDSDSDGGRASKKARKSSSSKDARKKDTSRSKSSKRSKDSKDRKRSKESKKKSSKGDRKHSKSHKSDKKKKRARSKSDSDSDFSSGSSDSSRSSSPATRSSAPASSSGSHAPSVPLPSASSVSRCHELLETLLQHGGGDRDESLQQVRFMLFKLDSGSSVDVSALQDPLVKHILSTMLRELGCKIRRDPATDEQGFMSPVDSRGRPAHQLLNVMADAFKPKPVAPIGPAAPPPQAAAAIGPTPPPSSATAASASAAASSSDATATAALRVLGPAMPGPDDFARLAAGEGDEPSAAAADAEEDDSGNFGPKMPSQMTPHELQAFERLRASREHLAQVHEMEKASGRRQEGGREEWMTALPTADPGGLPTTTMLANMAASGNADVLKARGFATKAVTRAGQDDEWAMSPAEKARRDVEKQAVRQAEQAVYNSSRAITGDLSDMLGGSSGRVSANASAAQAQAANDRMMARYKQQQVSTADSLVAAHARATASAAAAAKQASGGLFVWDHDKEMGMRAVKGAAALKKEMQSAFSLNDSFAPAGS